MGLSARAWERIQDKRLDAFEELLQLARFLSTTTRTGRHDDGLIETIPVFLSTYDDAQAGFTYIYEILTKTGDWVNGRTRRHLRYLTDYLQNSDIATKAAREGGMEELAIVTKSDIIDLATETREAAHYFYASINRRKFKYRGNGKYPLRVTRRRLSKTRLTKWMIKNDCLLRDGSEIPNSGKR